MIRPQQSISPTGPVPPQRKRGNGYRVNIRLDAPQTLCEGDAVTLTAEIIGLEGTAVDLQWQVYRDGAWENVPGATGLTCTFFATEESINLSWRLAVTARDE